MIPDVVECLTKGFKDIGPLKVEPVEPVLLSNLCMILQINIL
jgi:hypothetical protein